MSDRMPTDEERARECLADELTAGDAAKVVRGDLVLVSANSAVKAMLAFLAQSKAETAPDVGREGYAPCPTCRQYSHSLGEGALADAFMHFQSMFDHRGDGIPTQFSFDERTRDAAQVLMAAAKADVEREAIEAECYRDMHEIATQRLGYPSILEALEAAPHCSVLSSPIPEEA